MDSISLQQLQNLQALARYGSFGRAAEELRLSQPALSRSIQTLERTLGSVLVVRERGRTGIEFTDAGQVVLSRADEVLAGMAAIQNLSAVPGKTRLAFGIGPQYATALLPQALERMQAAEPDQQIDITIGPTMTMLSLLLAGDIEFFVSGAMTTVRPERLHFEKFGNSKMVLSVRHDHPLTKLTHIELHDIARYPVFTGSAFHERIRSGDDRIQPALLPTVVLDNFELLARLTATSDGILVSIASLATHPLVHLDFNLTREIGPSETFLYRLKSMRLSGPAINAIEELRTGLRDDE